VTVSCPSVGAAAELSVVRPPRVGRFDDPTEPEAGMRDGFGVVDRSSRGSSRTDFRGVDDTLVGVEIDDRVAARVTDELGREDERRV
jgi:hypothetical protein